MSEIRIRRNGWWLLLTLFAFALLGGMSFGTSRRPTLPRRAIISFATQPYTQCGSLSFSPPITYSTEIRPRSATTGDFNHDGHPDLVITDYSFGSISVLLGNGDGTFQPHVEYAAHVHPVTAAVGVLNERCMIPEPRSSNYDSADVTVLLGNGDGTFNALGNFGSEHRPLRAGNWRLQRRYSYGCRCL